MVGEEARKKLESDPTLASIRISRAHACEVFKVTGQPIWDRIVERFPELSEDETPSAVQTAVLSLAVAMGTGNRLWEELAEPLPTRAWNDLGDRIEGLKRHDVFAQQSRRAKGLEHRAQLIRTDIEKDN